MEHEQQVYGSAELTPDVIRRAQFSMSGDGYAPGDVHAFLEQVASAIEVLRSEPGPAAVRSELVRVQETTAKMVLASQEAAARLRETGAEDARAIVDDARRLASELGERAEREFSGAREHVETVRAQFIQELRDMYDRIGATLYRFEHAEQPATDRRPAAPTPEEPVALAEPESEPEFAVETVAEPAPAPEPALATEPEPLVDLRSIGAELEPEASAQAVEAAPSAESVPDDESGWLIEPVEPVPEAPTAVAGTGYVDMGDVLTASSPARLPDESVGGFEPAATFEPATPMAESSNEPDVAMQQDDARAEALLAGMNTVFAASPTQAEPAPVAPEPQPQPAPLPEPPTLGEPQPQVPAAHAIDPASLRAFVLQSLQEGSPRDAVEAYLSGTLGIADPASIVNAILTEAAPPA